MTNIPSGLKDASNVELLDTGLTLYVDNYMYKYRNHIRKDNFFSKTFLPTSCEKYSFQVKTNSQVFHGMSQEHEYAHP